MPAAPATAQIPGMTARGIGIRRNAGKEDADDRGWLSDGGSMVAGMRESPAVRDQPVVERVEFAQTVGTLSAAKQARFGARAISRRGARARRWRSAEAKEGDDMEVDARRAAGVAAGEPVAALVSGGLDSAVLLASLAADGPVTPIYVSCGLAWEPAEREAVERLRDVLSPQRVRPIVDLVMPLTDLYGDHWSVSGQGVPDADSPDSAVELLGRNAVLALKPLLWCGREGVGFLAIATLAGNPFPDASQGFFLGLADVVATATGCDVRLVAPFRELTKSQLVQAASGDVLKASMSCLMPIGQQTGWLHCGACNKCRERQHGFRQAGVAYPTYYAANAPW